MKKIVAVVIVLMMIAPLFPAFADGTWYCPKCGQQNTDNFCPKDGTPRPADTGNTVSKMNYTNYSHIQCTLNNQLATRTGPSTRYDEPGTFLSAGKTVTALSKVYDQNSEIWWVQVEFSESGKLYWAYTGLKRLNGLNLANVPEEDVIGNCTTTSSTVGYYAPSTKAAAIRQSIPTGIECTIYGYVHSDADDYVQIEFYDSGLRTYRRAWVKDETVIRDRYSAQNDDGDGYGYTSSDNLDWLNDDAPQNDGEKDYGNTSSEKLDWLNDYTVNDVIAEMHTSIKQVSLGGYHSAMLLEDGSLYLWGNNSEGQLGNATTKDTYIPQKNLNHVRSVSLGNKHSAALLEDGSLWLWGSNDKGQLGDGTTADKSRPVKVLQDVKSVSLGYETSAALKTDGSLWMWGSNSGGQQGDNGLQYSTTPVQVNIQGLDSDMQEIYLGYAHCAALKEDGSLWMWGANNYGQLGNGTTTSVPGKAIKIMEDVKCVSLGENHSAAVKNDGTLWMWGANSNAQLGDGSTTDKVNPVLVLQNVRQVALGYSHSVALQNDGYVWITGEGWESQIIGYPTIRPSESVYVLSGVGSIFVGGKHNAALDEEDGSLWMWGNDQYGQSGVPAPSAQVGFPMFPGSSVIGKYMKQIYDGDGQFLYEANNAEYDIGYDIAVPADSNITTDR